MGDRKASKSGGLSRTGVGGSFGSKTDTFASDSQSLSQFGENEDYATGGADTSVICELTCGESHSSALVPHRIVRQMDGLRCAVLFISSISGSGGKSSTESEGMIGTDARVEGKVMEPSPDPVAFTILDSCISKKNKQTTFKLHHGRDIVMLPPSENGTESIIVLDSEGYTLSEFTRTTIKDEVGTDTIEWQKELTVPIFKGASSVDDVIEGRRILALFTGQPRLMIVGTRYMDGRTCILFSNNLTPPLEKAGKFCSLSDLMPGNESQVISGKEEMLELYLQQGEEVISFAELPSKKINEQSLVAIATQFRVMIISPVTAEILSEAPTRLACNSLVPMGSHCVSYCSASSATGCGIAKIRYLNCLEMDFSSGVIATLPTPRCGYAPHLLLAVRPDRFIYLSSHSGTRLVEYGENYNKFLFPIPQTRPAFLLEPMVANALCQDSDSVQTTLCTIVERFGRKVVSFPHEENEGIGCLGTGLTEKLYSMLKKYNCEEAASFLLTGNSRRHKNALSKVLPPWIPMQIKASTASSCEHALQVLSSDDRYLAEYIMSPADAMPCALPRTTDPTSILSKQLAIHAMQSGNISDALRFLDLSGSETSETTLIQVVLSLQLNPDANVEKCLRGIVGDETKNSSRKRRNSCSSSSASIAALALDLKRRQVNGKVPLEAGECGKISDEISGQWAKQLAPSVQRGSRVTRSRNRLVDSAAFAIAKNEEKYSEEGWRILPDESKHVWSTGPFGEKEELLSLDRFEEWLGKRRPAIMGKTGAEMAADTGKYQLDKILAAAKDNDSDERKSQGEEENESKNGGWVPGIGEGRDEENLSAYFRFSEGADEDSNWRADGISDISKHQHKAVIYGSEAADLEATTSYVDEGVGGKVKLLYDLVFNERIDRDRTAGLLVEVARGSSLDVGMLHGDDHESRKRCSIECWYRLPNADLVTEEIILMRRSLSTPDEEDMSKLCLADNKTHLMWELVLLASGSLELRTSGGSILNSSKNNDTCDTEEKQPAINENSSDDDTEKGKDSGMVLWERPDGTGGWNHVCVIFSSRSQNVLTDCSAKLMMQGTTVASAVVSIQIQENDQPTNIGDVDRILAKSALLFGLGSVPGFRMTEVRVWSCERAEDEVNMNMYHYLSAAETKRKIKVKIGGKKKVIGRKLGGNLLAPPTPGETLRGDRSRRRRVDTDVEKEPTSNKAANNDFQFDAAFENMNDNKETKGNGEGTNPLPQSQVSSESIDEKHSFSQSIFSSEKDGKTPENLFAEKDGKVLENLFAAFPFPTKDDAEISHNKDFTLNLSLSDKLSQQVRSSAAAAIIRGPPATRHFGGNRGGLATSPLPNYGNRLRGVGAIAICGQEKTVLYTHDKTPPGKTLPIGASGAIISDIMDSQGSEYLCCFLAKEKRIVVFELKTKTVVVELQMTTKLNFWRYLPPAAHGNTLVFMLITPVGGFHWMPLNESPRPQQAWKRGPELQVSSYLCASYGLTF
uniref:Uncharacterized protein n=1 Tax=Ditylum brightwellii TaxID=49249 RepID=A0A7S4S381_9STRA